SDRYGAGGGDRGWWDRASDEVASWFGDEEAERRRRMDAQRDQYRGKGPKGYRRSDERIKEDVNDRLSEGYMDASDIEVSVQNAEVTLTGTVNSRADKRRAEDIAESVSGVSNVENRLRVKQGGSESYGSTSSTQTGYGSSMGTSGTTGSTGTTGYTGSTGATGTTGSSETGGATSTSSAAAGAGGTGTTGTTGSTGTSRTK
ncbi:MAG TPA: BON domain-containing protein, partial [Pyrinomonadaceae bacterium]|nr:BON domain-containing protein [Pyrinomonadaceae bacterium]